MHFIYLLLMIILGSAFWMSNILLIVWKMNQIISET
jgi:hypothetical protein